MVSGLGCFYHQPFFRQLLYAIEVRADADGFFLLSDAKFNSAEFSALSFPNRRGKHRFDVLHISSVGSIFGIFFFPGYLNHCICLVFTYDLAVGTGR